MFQVSLIILYNNKYISETPELSYLEELTQTPFCVKLTPELEIQDLASHVVSTIPTS